MRQIQRVAKKKKKIDLHRQSGGRKNGRTNRDLVFVVSVRCMQNKEGRSTGSKQQVAGMRGARDDEMGELSARMCRAEQFDLQW